ncbi:M23 family metallopeptidase [Oceanobacillus manasiensis]|uniref:M23 family metallopeptidase n=1 Tax=Oceanobacillus manasiensis TaxID=586413 RepID=UPI0005A8FDED|nr:M23 family metallopeptidase [Oceanobacillus manasiensis]
MNEENKASKNKWSRIFKKKWFFPAVYLTIAALLLSVVVWYQNMDNQIPDAQEDQENYVPTPNEEEAEPVLEHQEVIQMPLADQEQAEIVTKFYDYNADQEDQENALVLYNNRYYQSTGVDIASASGETFDVVAALTGTIEEVKEDPLLGNVVVVSHENDVKTYYASLEKVSVKAGAEVKQGDQLGTAGKNLFGQDSGTHVYFELRKEDKHVNPEDFFNQPVSSLESALEEAVDSTESDEATESSEEEAVENEASEENADDEDKTEEEDAPADEEEDDASNEESNDATDSSESA